MGMDVGVGLVGASAIRTDAFDDEMDKWEGSQLNQAKEILAFELTKLVHGEEEAAESFRVYVGEVS